MLKIKTLLVSQPRPETAKSPYFDIEERCGVKIDFRPFIKVEPILSPEFRQQKVSIQDYSAFIFTSKHGIDHFFRLVGELRIKINENWRYFCMSETVAFYLQKYIQFKKRKVSYTQTGKVAELVTMINRHASEKFLVVLAEGNNDDFLAAINQSKATLTPAFMYRTVSNDFTAEDNIDYDMLMFFSPQGIISLMKNFPDFKQGETHIGCFGATTAQAVRDAKLRLDLEIPTPQFSSATQALDWYIRENHKLAKKG